MQKQNRNGLVRTMTFSKPVLLMCVLMFARHQRVVTSLNVQLQVGMEKLLGFLFL